MAGGAKNTKPDLPNRDCPLSRRHGNSWIIAMKIHFCEAKMARTTLIRNADFLVAYDAGADTHRYRKGCDLVFTDDRIVHVGPGFSGQVDETIDASGMMVMPGLVDIHSHPSLRAHEQGLERRARLGETVGLLRSTNSCPLFRPDAQGGVPAASSVAYCELLMSGVTTLVGHVRRLGWLARSVSPRAGLRGVVSPMYRSARWYTKNGHVVEYEWEPDGGEKAMAQAMALLDEVAQHPSGRLSGMVSPSQIDTCTAELIQASFREAEKRAIPFQIHAAQSVVGIPRTDPPAGHDADRVAGIPRRALAAIDHRPRHLSRSSQLGPELAENAMILAR